MNKSKVHGSRLAVHGSGAVSRATRHVSRRALRGSRGFNMVEIALAIGIIGFALVSILGLFAVGLNASRDTADDSMASLLVQAVVADRRSTPYSSITPPITATTFEIPALDSPAASWPYILYFKKSGGVPVITNAPNIGQGKAGYYYEVDITNSAPAALATGLAIFDIRVSWPANTHLTNRTTYFYTTTFSRH